MPGPAPGFDRSREEILRQRASIQRNRASKYRRRADEALEAARAFTAQAGPSKKARDLLVRRAELIDRFDEVR